MALSTKSNETTSKHTNPSTILKKKKKFGSFVTESPDQLNIDIILGSNSLVTQIALKR